jgi:leucyl aminopeptidase
MKVSIAELNLPKTGVLAFTISKKGQLGPEATKLDKLTGGKIAQAMKIKGFKGDEGEVLTVLAPSGTSLDSITLVGTGVDKAVLSHYSAMCVGGKLLAELLSLKTNDATLVCEGIQNNAEATAYIAFGALLRSYRFDIYRTKEKKEDKPVLKQLAVQTQQKKEAEKDFKALQKIAEGVFVARDVVSEPPNKLYPVSYADRIKAEFAKTDVKVSFLNEKQMQKLGMGALLGVGQGSIRESRVVVMEYKGAGEKSKKAPIAFVGKGVTFDTGGISIKPSSGMEDMKYDMGGSAAVFGVMKALSGRKAKVNAIGIVGLVENMPDGNAQRPSDVVRSMSGQTIEVLNTDAEGRLVLADILWYCQEKYKPEVMIDLATLTGAITIALGNQYAGIFANDDTLTQQLCDAGQKTHERLWPFPMGKEYDKYIDSPIADMQNMGSGKGAGSITAAQFLKRFVQDGVKWAHLDIAGVAWNKEGLAFSPKGAVGFGVRLLDRWVQDSYEK